MAETLGVPYSSEQAWREELARERDDRFAIVACVQDEVVGHLALSVYMNPRTRHSGHFGIAVRDDWQGRGVGTALMEACLDLADNWLNLTRLDLRVYTDNAPAIALYTKFGFEIEGTHRRFAYRNGGYVDAHVMARLRTDCDPPAPGKIYERETSERSGAVAQCEVCGNDYDKAISVTVSGGDSHTFDSFECAIHALAPACEYCNVKVIGHGIEADGSFYCCAHCARMAGAEGVSDRV
jgi:putative acetyltransferase